MKLKLTILFCLVVGAMFSSCDKTKTVVLSKYNDGNPQEIIELNLPITKDSVGVKTVYYENGKVRAFGQSKYGKRQGEWICYFPDGKVEWKAVFKNDVENGKVICFKRNGEWTQNKVCEGVKHGKATSYFYDSFDSIYCYSYGQYVKGLKHGLWTKTDTSGVLLVETTYVDGETVGYFTNRYTNGKMRLKGRLEKDGSMKDFKFYDENGIEKELNNYFLRKI